MVAAPQYPNSEREGQEEMARSVLKIIRKRRESYFKSASLADAIWAAALEGSSF